MAPTKTFNLAGLQTSSIVVPNPKLRELVNRGINTDEVAEPNAFAIEGESWIDALLEYLMVNKMRIISIGQDEYIATLLDSKAVEGFITQLPLKLSLQDYAGAEKISDLPTRLYAGGSPSGTAASIGDLAYYTPWGNLAIFYKSSGYASGQIKLGSIEYNAKKLASIINR